MKPSKLADAGHLTAPAAPRKPWKQVKVERMPVGPTKAPSAAIVCRPSLQRALVYNMSRNCFSSSDPTQRRLGRRQGINIPLISSITGCPASAYSGRRSCPQPVAGPFAHDVFGKQACHYMNDVDYTGIDRPRHALANEAISIGETCAFHFLQAP